MQRSCFVPVSYKRLKGLGTRTAIADISSVPRIFRTWNGSSYSDHEIDAYFIQTESFTGIISSKRVGTIYTPSLKVSTRDNITFSIRLAYPSNVLNTQEMINITIVVLGDKNRSVSLSFETFDGTRPRLISVTQLNRPYPNWISPFQWSQRAMRWFIMFLHARTCRRPLELISRQLKVSRTKQSLQRVKMGVVCRNTSSLSRRCRPVKVWKGGFNSLDGESLMKKLIATTLNIRFFDAVCFCLAEKSTMRISRLLYFTKCTSCHFGYMHSWLGHNLFSFSISSEDQLCFYQHSQAKEILSLNTF